MSRPPRPYPSPQLSREVSGGLPVRNGVLQVFAPSFQDLIDVQNGLSAQELGLLPPGGEGDFAATLFELSAVVAHVLGVYQDFYGGEAFLGTAQTQQSLVRHGRRVGYTTDPGVAATGVIAIQAKKGLSGDIAPGLGLLSVPKGEQIAQTYETLEARHVDVRWNVILPTDVTVPRTSIPAGVNSLDVQGVSLGIVPGDTVVLILRGVPAVDSVQPVVRTVQSVSENAPVGSSSVGSTTLTLDSALTEAILANLGEYRVLAKPALDLRLFGWNADPRIFPPHELQTAGAFQSQAGNQPQPTPGPPGSAIVVTSDPVFGYQVFGNAQDGTPDNTPAPTDLYLSEALSQSLLDQWVLRVSGDGKLTPYFVMKQQDLSVSFVREESQTIVVNPPAPTDPNGTQGAPVFTQQVIPQWFSASTTRIQVQESHGEPLQRAAAGNDLRNRWIAGWALELPLQIEQPNPAPVLSELVLDGDFTGLEPGMLIVLSSVDRTIAQLVELTAVEVFVPGTSGGATTATPTTPSTTIRWKARGPAPVGTSFIQSDTIVLGNVIRVSHGKTINEVLGDSDGVTPFLRFALKKTPVTHLPEATGAVPALEVRISDVLWTRVEDFAQSGPDDRVYIVQRTDTQVTQVLFGDGRKGAIPPSGRRHIQASYRIGLGVIGNVEVGRLSRIEKAHPLVESLVNPLPIAGGTEPAAIDQVRQQSTRFIRTFDRAVSASDYADLALLFPGVARTQATALPTGGIQLVAADADGHPLGDILPFKNFLDARRDRGVPLTFQDPEGTAVFVSIEVEFDPAFFSFQVEQAVRNTLIGTAADAPGLFTFRGRQLGEPGHLSRVYEAINRAAGVVFSQVVHFDRVAETSTDPVTGLPVTTRHVRDVIQVAPFQWLSLDAANLHVVAVTRRDD